jgi:uncharacterized protein DUF1580
VIDLSTETRIPLAVAASETPPGRNGKRTHLSTILRWILTGAKAPDGSRVRLEAIRLGGRWFTTREALQRFAERLTPRLDGNNQPTPRGPEERRRASERAATELDKLGV